MTVKRLIDVAISAAALLILSPLFLIVALVIKLDSRGGPILTIRIRPYYDNRILPLLVFRCNGLFHSPSLFGRLLTRVGIDRLPMLLNVLRGDLSIVGPRCPASNISTINTSLSRILLGTSLRPGLLSLADVATRLNGKVEKQEGLESDLVYVMNWSLLLDAKIVFRYLFSRSSYLQQ